MDGPLRVAVVGAGAFGRNHLRVYSELQSATPPPVRLCAVVEPGPVARDHVTAQYGVPVFATVAELLASGIALDAVSVCVPTVHHALVAEQLLRAGLDVLIEKPFADKLEDAKRILKLSESLGRIIQVGHLERFNPAVTALSERINRPMFFECHRLSIFTPRALDVDVVLDLMIHDLDVVLSLVKSEVREVRAVGLPVLSGKVDIANARVEFESGCIANFTASRISTERVRKLRLFQHAQYLSLDFARQELFSIDVDADARRRIAEAMMSSPAAPLPVITPSAASETAARAGAHAKPEGAVPEAARPEAKATSEPTGIHPSAGLTLHRFDLPRAEPLALELADFLQAVRNRTEPRVPGKAGCEALALALKINAEIATHAQRAGL